MARKKTASAAPANDAKAVVIHKKRPVRARRVTVEVVNADPVESIHKVVHHVAEAVKAGRRVYDAAKPFVDAMRRRK